MNPQDKGTPRRWRALIATSDKRQLIELGRCLHGLNWEIAATKGTAALLRSVSVPVLDVASLVETPELLGGRLKTLTLGIFGGLLMRHGNPEDEGEASRWNFLPIDMLVSGFYDLEATGPSAIDEECWVERIDVGGPSMLRAAAKNHHFVIPLVSPDDYQPVADALSSHKGDPSGVSLSMRRRLAGAAFRRLSRYDEAIAKRLEHP